MISLDYHITIEWAPPLDYQLEPAIIEMKPLILQGPSQVLFSQLRQPESSQQLNLTLDRQ